MRKWSVFILLACLLTGLCACSGVPRVPPALELPGIPWNSSPEAVFKILGLDPAEPGETQEDPSGLHFTVAVPEMEIFGQKSVTAYFRFDNFTPDAGDHFGLTGVQIFYPEDCDQDPILKNLRNRYGPEAREYTLYSIADGQPEPRQYTWKEGNFAWFSPMLAGNVLSDNGRAAYRSVLGEITDEGFDACLAAPAANIRWCADYYGMFEDARDLMREEGRVAWLSLNGSILVQMMQTFECIE